MSFSDYISKYAYKDYLAYCKQNKIIPAVDISLRPPKLCALVKPRLDPKSQ